MVVPCGVASSSPSLTCRAVPCCACQCRQVELVNAQLKRAKGRVDPQDDQLYAAVKGLVKREGEPAALLDSVVQRLHLRSEGSWRQEVHALEAKKKKSGLDRGAWSDDEIDRIIRVVNRIVWVPSDDEYEDGLHSVRRSDKPSTSKGYKRKVAPTPPDDFKCPISLELLRDPVIVATGQASKQPRPRLCFPPSSFVALTSPCCACLPPSLTADVRKGVHPKMAGRQQPDLPQDATEALPPRPHTQLRAPQPHRAVV